MAMYTFNQKQTRIIQQAIREAPAGYKIYFQPTHHGGCVQVLKMKAGSKTETDYCIDTFKSSVSGYKTFYRRTIGLQNVLKLKKEWIETILKAKTIRFLAEYTRNRRVAITLEWKCR